MTHNVYSIFGNQVRTKIVMCLAQKPKTVSDLIHNCKLSQSAVSQHLKKLKTSGIVQTKKVGRTIWYWVPNKKVIAIAKQIVAL